LRQKYHEARRSSFADRTTLYDSYPPRQKLSPGPMSHYSAISRRNGGRAFTPRKRDRFRQMAENIRRSSWMDDGRHQEDLYVNPAYATITGSYVENRYANTCLSGGPFTRVIASRFSPT